MFDGMRCGVAWIERVIIKGTGCKRKEEMTERSWNALAGMKELGNEMAVEMGPTERTALLECMVMLLVKSNDAQDDIIRDSVDVLRMVKEILQANKEKVQVYDKAVLKINTVTPLLYFCVALNVMFAVYLWVRLSRGGRRG